MASVQSNMDAAKLSRRDDYVLEKIRDPEADPMNAVMVDPSLPKDPALPDPAVYKRVSQRERDIVLSMQHLEMQLAGLKAATQALEPVKEYRTCVSRLGDLVSEYPKYGSARNNRAQALRRLYGDAVLLQISDSRALVQNADGPDRRKAAVLVLSDLDEAIAALTPPSPFAAISPQAGKTLSLAHTQRAAIYHATAKSLSTGAVLDVDPGRKEAKWTMIEFEEAASRDFALGGRYGNEVAKGLAVATNPTAKLCGQMVREAMKKEYGPSLDV